VAAGERQRVDRAAARQHVVGADDVGDLPVSPFDQHVGREFADEAQRRRLAEAGDVVDHFECRHHLAAIAQLDQRPFRPLEAPHRGIGIECHHQDVAERPGGTQIAHVPGVQEIETAVGEDDPAPPAALCSEFGAQRGASPDLPAGAFHRAPYRHNRSAAQPAAQVRVAL